MDGSMLFSGLTGEGSDCEDSEGSIGGELKEGCNVDGLST